MPAASATTAPERRRILLLGWDAADWDHIQPLLAEGLMPSLRGLMDRGVWGNLATLQPMVSPMLWTTIATGKTADQHGVLGFYEPGDGGMGSRPWGSLGRKCKAIWNVLQQHGWRCNVTGWWASHPAEPLDGIVVANTITNVAPDGAGGWKVPEGCIHPVSATQHLASLKMLPQEITSEHLLPFVPLAAEIDQDRDFRLAGVARLISDCVTIQSIATEIMEMQPWDFMAVYFDGIDHFCHGFMPYHPPQLPHIRDREFELYREVVRGAYRFHDMMLERLLQLAGPETTVILCSDHGFLSGVNRPTGNPNDPAGPAIWHRDMGMLVMAGPGIKPAGRIYGASLLDITPTLLSLCGLPVAKDMPGKALTMALTSPGPGERIASWEEVPGNDGRHPPGVKYGATGPDTALTKQLVALGYLEDSGGDEARAAQSARMEADYNLAQVHLAINEPETAVPLLEGLLRERPWESRYIHQLANALVRAGWFAQGVELLRRAYPEDAAPPPPAVFLLMARACLGMGDNKTAGWYAARAARAMPVLSGSYVELGNLFLILDEYAAAELAFRRALELDPSYAAAWEGLSSVHLRRDENELALEAGLEAVHLLFQMAEAHLNIGIALTRLGRMDESRAAFEQVTTMRPKHPLAWRFLASLPVKGEASGFVRDACREQARRLSRSWAAASTDVRSRARELRPIPDLPGPAERSSRAAFERPATDVLKADGAAGRTFTIVSGLPRSGTSLMMQMLAAGGLPPLTDGIRAADEDNPGGYLEWEPIKTAPRNPSLLDAEGLDLHAIKCISALLPALPAKHRYRVIFMSRSVDEIVRSQERMKQRRGTTDGTGPEELTATLTRHRDDILQFIRARPRTFNLLIVDYPSLVNDPAPVAEHLATFLGPQLLPDSANMLSAVRRDLHRVRNEK